jgi:cyanophycin synthetase
VPPDGQTVRLERVANYHAGGNLLDVTDELHPSVQATARAVAKYFNVGIIGVDCISPNIAETMGAIIEINATPAITIHHFPDQGQPRNAAAAIIDMLFPETISV